MTTPSGKKMNHWLLTTQAAIVTTLVAMGTAHAQQPGQTRVAAADTATVVSGQTEQSPTRKKGEAGEEPERAGPSAAASGVGRHTDDQTKALHDSHERNEGARHDRQPRSTPTPDDTRRGDRPDPGADSLERARQR